MNADVSLVSVAEEPGVADFIEDRALDGLVAADNVKRRDKYGATTPADSTTNISADANFVASA